MKITMVQKIANAIKARRRELIARPLDQCFNELAISVLRTMEEFDDELFDNRVDQLKWKYYINKIAKQHLIGVNPKPVKIMEIKFNDNN